jgi:flagellar basal-body rod modification protein FlgD
MSDTISTVTNLLNTSSTSSSSSSSTLGKDDFLKLMIEQLKSQDPLNPTDATQYTSQLAQYSSLEQLSNINETLNDSITANQNLTLSINNTLSATLIGKSIKVSGNDLTYNGQDSVTLGYELPSNASSISLKIYDSNGNLVKTITDLSKTSGEHKLSWDFTDNNGDTVSKGDYTFEVVAKNSDDEKLSVDLFKSGVVSSIKYTSSGTKFVVDDAEYYLSDVIEILNTSDGK